MKNSIIFQSFIFCTVLFITTPVMATPISWTIQGLTFPGGSVTGGFTYDSMTDTYSDINITVPGATGGSFVTPSGAGCCTSTQLALIANPPASVGDPFLIINFGSALTDAGGTVSISRAVLGTCTDATALCTSIADEVEATQLGSVRGVSAVPEPGTILLLSTGLLGLAGYRWSQQRRERWQVG